MRPDLTPAMDHGYVFFNQPQRLHIMRPTDYKLLRFERLRLVDTAEGPTRGNMIS